MTLTKAVFIIMKTGGDEQIPVMFNPSKYEIKSSINHVEIKNIGRKPTPQYKSANNSTLSLELFFDTYEQGTDVRDYTKKLMALVELDSDQHAPPACRFVWGSLDFKGVVTSIDQSFTMFLGSGIPVRARLNLNLLEYKTLKDQNQEKPFHSADRTKQKALNDGEQLWMLAHAEYEDPGRWREIAKANGIDNPRKVQTAKQYTVPRLE